MAWINLAVLVVSTLVFLYLYVRSVSPARLERRIDPVAYRRCTVYRFAAFGVMGISTASYVAYLFYPLPLGLARTFPWPWWISACIAVLILLPSGMLFWRGMRDAGEETMVVLCLAEERDLVERYGEAYVGYQRETGRFFPRMGPDRQVGAEEGL